MSDEVLVLRDETGREHRVNLESDGTVRIGELTISVTAASDGSLHVEGTENTLVWTATTGEIRWVFVDGEVHTFEPARSASRRRATSTPHATLTAPMPATVRQLLVHAGDAVSRNDILIVLEAMKMELPVRATFDGRVERINCREGELVEPGVGLIELAKPDGP